ncbi:hypothetical protein D3C87_1180770 [compost metagenome]
MHLILRTIVLRTIPPARSQRAELLRTNGGCRAAATDIAENIDDLSGGDDGFDFHGNTPRVDP